MKFWKRTKSLPQMIQELKELTVKYAKQETIEPLKGLGRFIGFGAMGSFALGIGLVLWVLAALRALQEQTGDTFTGHLTWVPYMITLLGCLVVCAFAYSAIWVDKRVAEKRKKEREAAAVDASVTQ